MADPTLLHPHWLPPGRFTLKAGAGRHADVAHEDPSALVALWEESGHEAEAQRLADEIDRLLAAAEAHVERGSDAPERTS